VGDTGELSEGQGEVRPPRLTGTSALRTHVTLSLGLLLCGGAFWFELGRAERGNELSWAYVFEWPLLGIFGIYMWWKILHPGFSIKPHPRKPAIAPEYQGMLLAWQDEVRRLEQERRTEEADAPLRDDRGHDSLRRPRTRD